MKIYLIPDGYEKHFRQVFAGGISQFLIMDDCQRCQASGIVSEPHLIPRDLTAATLPCPNCGGTGSVNIV